MEPKKLLWGIDYHFGLKFPELESVEVEKETAKSYTVSMENTRVWLGYRTRIPKDSSKVFHSPMAAMMAYRQAKIEKWESLQQNMRLVEECIREVDRLIGGVEKWVK